MTLCFITKNSKMWKTQRYKCYGMIIDTNSHEKTKDTNCYEKKKGTNCYEISRDIGLPLPILSFKPKGAS